MLHVLRFGRYLAWVTALVGITGLILQLYLLLTQLPVTTAIWRFLGYFTILSNIAASATALSLATPLGDKIGSGWRIGVATAISLTGIVYSVALRSTWSPTGWQAVADHLLHDAVPLLFLATLVSCSKNAPHWKHVAASIVGPVFYCVYALVRGSFDGWYAYWFLNPTETGWATMSLYIAVLIVTVLAIGVALVWISRVANSLIYRN